MTVVPGTVLRHTFALVARARGARALHPRGAVVPGRVRRSGLRWAPVGVPWIDEPGEDRARVRLSRGVGLPPPLPDLLGLTLRIDGRGDLLLTTAALRYVLVPRVDPRQATYTSIVPFHTSTGRVMIGAVPAPSGFSLRVAGVVGGWREFAVLTLDDAPGAAPDDAALDADPMRHPIEGLVMPGWLARTREPAYDASRRGRHGDPERADHEH
jgi:hypothetical protein